MGKILEILYEQHQAQKKKTEKAERELKEIKERCDKLAELEKLEKQGLLVHLPCKAGDSLYKVIEYAKEPIIEMQVTEVTFIDIFGDKTIRIETRYYDCNHRIKYEDSYLSSDIGWRVFLTRKEAEAKLREINESIMRIGRE